MFKIGQEVVCIKTSKYTPEIKEGKIFTIHGIWNCCLMNLDVGIRKDVVTRCAECHALSDTVNIVWKKASHFAPLISNQELQEILNEVEEPVLL